MNCVFLNSIDAISAEHWDGVVNSDYPFLRHAFLAAMEHSESACTESGWQPQHLVVMEAERPVAVMPLYLKSHSYGEYIFDWSWASAYQRYGLDYYPKLVSAIPFTPATGPRLCANSAIDRDQLDSLVAAALRQRAEQLQASSVHILAAEQSEAERWSQQSITRRTSSQFHWYNDNYSDFDDFLSSFASRKRKNLKKERRRIAEQGITLERISGDQLSAELWDVFFRFYQLTYAKRSGHGGYLTRAFFDQLSATMGEQVMLVMASHNEQYVAGALYFYSASTLYGRYWGCTEEFEMLHFEACYYQGIEFCIERGLSKFDAGAQGEHKIQRGFTPTAIWSNHWIKDQQFAAAIDDFIVREAEGNSAYIDDAKTYLPFKKG